MGAPPVDEVPCAVVDADVQRRVMGNIHENVPASEEAAGIDLALCTRCTVLAYRVPAAADGVGMALTQPPSRPA
jgi:hypothetical protein